MGFAKGVAKKMRIFCEGRWKSSLCAAILFASFIGLASQGAGTGAEAEGTGALRRAVDAVGRDPDKLLGRCVAAERDLKGLRERFADVLLNAEKQRESFARSSLSVVGAVATGVASDSGRQEAELRGALSQCVREGGKLSGAVAEFCRHLQAKLPGMPLPDDEKLRLRLRVEEVAAAAGRFDLLVAPALDAPAFGQCRVLDVNDKLQVVALSAGLKDGLRSGLGLEVPEAGGVKLRLVMVRLFVSAAVVVEGDMAAVAPGMLAKAGGSGGRP